MVSSNRCHLSFEEYDTVKLYNRTRGMTKKCEWEVDWVKQQSVATGEKHNLFTTCKFWSLWTPDCVSLAIQPAFCSGMEWKWKSDVALIQTAVKTASKCCFHYIFLPLRGNAVSQMLPPCVRSPLQPPFYLSWSFCNLHNSKLPNVNKNKLAVEASQRNKASRRQIR